MQNKSLRILSVGRSPESGPNEEIFLRPGMNVIVGKPNSGKSSWLKFIDYLLGSTKGDPNEVLGEQLASKYSTAWVTLELAGVSHRVERRWTGWGGKNRLSLDDLQITPEEFSDFVLEQLGTPAIRYPSGDPYAERSWPTLSWRTLMRHAYRREDQWVSLIPKQPEGAIHACMLEFAGLAQAVYPPALANYIDKRRLVRQLIARRDNFVQVLRQVTEELLGFGLPDGDLSREFLENKREDIDRQRSDLENDRESYTLENQKHHDKTTEPPMHDVAEELAEIDSQMLDLAAAIEGTRLRIVEMKDHTDLIRHEGQRLRRAMIAGNTLADLKITHCPACDEPVQSRSGNCCFLCGKPATSGIKVTTDQRMEFERAQVKEELKESEQLLASLEAGLEELLSSRNIWEHRRSELRETQSSLVESLAILDDPRLREIDMRLGSLAAKQAQIESLKRLLLQREELSLEIGNLERKIDELETEIKSASEEADFDLTSQLLSDAMNKYLAALNTQENRRWHYDGDVVFDLRKNGYSLRVQGKSWTSKLGGTLRLYFYLAYHYAMMAAMTGEGRHYPGILILDFPPDRLAVSTGFAKISEHEGYVLNSFTHLCATNPNFQVIATGYSYRGLQANRVQLDTVWT
jgi:hypothetical protein